MRSLAFTVFALIIGSQTLAAQENAVVTGRVVNDRGAPEVAVSVRINDLNVGTATIQDGTYRMVVPASRIPKPTNATITASRQGLSSSSRTIALAAGANVTQNFQLSPSSIILEGVKSKTKTKTVPLPKQPDTTKTTTHQ